MTDKQIEETLERNAKNISGGFDNEVLNYINRLKAEIKMLNKSDTSKEDCTIAQYVEIKRLREENEDMYNQNHNLQTYINNHEEIWKRNAEIDTAIVRKETAKEVLDKVEDKLLDRRVVLGREVKYGDITTLELDDIRQEYGVEVDNE